MIILLIFWGTSKLFHNGYVILHPYQQVQKFYFVELFLYFVANIFYLLFIIHSLKGDSSFWLGFHFTDT